jgi:hypothetical protein
MNIKGSGKGETRACKYSQRVAVMLDGAIEERKVYQMQLPATSVFGDGNKDKMPLQAYGRLLRANNTHPISIVTKMRFDIDAAVPTLTFSAVRPLTQDELDVCVEMRDSPAAINAITLSVGETDGAKAGKKAEEKKPELFEPEEDESEVDESEEEVVVEKRVEVPVEVIKEVEVEKIVEKEIPVEVIKEVEKIVYIQDKKDVEVVSNLDNIYDKKDEIISQLKIKIEELENQTGQGNKEKMLQQTLVKLKKELSLKNEKIKELEKINEQLKIDNQPKGAVFLRGSNLNE